MWPGYVRGLARALTSSLLTAAPNFLILWVWGASTSSKLSPEFEGHAPSAQGPKSKKVQRCTWQQKHSTRGSRVIPQHSTNLAQTRLTSEIGRDRVLSGWYDRAMRAGEFTPALIPQARSQASSNRGADRCETGPPIGRDCPAADGGSDKLSDGLNFFDGDLSGAPSGSDRLPRASPAAGNWTVGGTDGHRF